MYLNQKGIAQQKLAEIFLSCGIGERIPTFSDLQKELKVGIGTIQTAIKELEMNGIIQLQAQQRYGTILTGEKYERTVEIFFRSDTWSACFRNL